MVKHVIFIRHGESEHHVKGMTGGWTDMPLTELGRQQIARTARYLKSRDLQVGRIFSSDLIRAHQSAEIIASSIDAEIVSIAALREINHGEATGLTLEQASLLKRPAPTMPDLDWYPYDKAESWRELAARLEGALELITAKEDELAVIVGHGLSGQALFGAWLQIPLAQKISYQLDTASLTELKINQCGERQIVRLNYQPL